ncbi:hypothetical protein M0D21_13540 [Aquimarina sp. D1M17]|uniref:hypothetical protein n=1 Tax=Aquimarina acroporae TaxID=2937283 RepID=UPI0020C15600|nr:hypothetical protein [Aquimarina acroporae]MCK8522602.1 hypothetical protein [Aquimarina acroporae]
MQKITFIFVLCLAVLGHAQEIEMLNGEIIASASKVDAVHVINQTQGIGAVSNNLGYFAIRAKPGDTIAFSSIQYELKQHIVSGEDLVNESFKIELEQLVNSLDEIRVTQYTLTGKIEEDVHKIPTYTENLPFWSAAELKQMGVSGFNDAQSPVKNLALEENSNVLKTSIDLNLVADLISRTFRGKSRGGAGVVSKKMKEHYNEKFIVEILEVPETKYYDFIDFINEQPQTIAMTDTKDQLKILEYLITQRDIFFEKYNITK